MTRRRAIRATSIGMRLPSHTPLLPHRRPTNPDVYPEVNHEIGAYKAYTLKDDAEVPEDPDGRLEGKIPWRA